MKKKKLIINCIILSVSFFCIVILLLHLYLYNADKFHNDLLDYHASARKDTSNQGIGRRIIRNAKALAGKQVSRFVRWRMETNYLRTVLNEDEIIDRFLSKNTPVSIKRLDAWRLAIFNTRASYETLIKGINSDNPELRAAIAMALGHSNFPEARDLIRQLLLDLDECVVRGAIKGMALFEDSDAVATITEVLNDQERSEMVQIEAALALGNIDHASSLNVLLTAYHDGQSEELSDAIVTGLGRFPFEKTETFFRDIVSANQTPLDVRIVAVESLASSTREAIPFLLETAENSDDPELRESAGWTIGINANTGKFAKELSDLLNIEPDQNVRRRLYESMLTQEDVPIDDIMPLVLSETNPAAKIAGAHAMAVAIRQNSKNTATATAFNEKMVPSLRSRALGHGSLNLRLRTIFALRTARTRDAIEALKEISLVKDQRVAGAAKRALKAIEKSNNG